MNFVMPSDDQPRINCGAVSTSTESQLRMEPICSKHNAAGNHEIAVESWPIETGKETTIEARDISDENITTGDQIHHLHQRDESILDFMFRSQADGDQGVINQLDTQRTTERKKVLKEQSEPTASTSKGERSKPFPASDSLKNPRKSLPFLPRVSQYERHPLLQVRSGTGLSEFEIFLLEKELLKRKNSADDQCSDTESAECFASRRSVRERRLIPRSALSEPHPLLKRSVSGVCELEIYLMEKEKEVERRCHGDEKAATCDHDADDENALICHHIRQSKLEPRSGQWEKHALLEIKDETGLSEMERMFLEAEEKGEYNTNQQTIFSFQRQRLTPSTDEFSGCEISSCMSSIGEALLPNVKLQQKRVRFERQKVEADDSGIASSDANQSGFKSNYDVISDCNNRKTIGDHDDGCDDQQKKREKRIDENSSMIAARRADEKSRRSRTNASSSAKKSCCMS